MTLWALSSDIHSLIGRDRSVSKLDVPDKSNGKAHYTYGKAPLRDRLIASPHIRQSSSHNPLLPQNQRVVVLGWTQYFDAAIHGAALDVSDGPWVMRQ